jgi:probable phosphoglycerate mutase
MTARRVLLLRHGLTDYNAEGRFQGQTDVPLNETGLAQAAAAAERLAGRGITRVVSSDLQRAAVTARQVADRLDLPVTLDPRLQEINVGSWAGLTAAQIAQTDPDLWAPIGAGEDGRYSPIGETASGAAVRVASAIIELAHAAADDDVLLAVGHGFTTRLAALRLIGVDQRQAKAFHGIGNCHWTELRPQEPTWRLYAYNCS